MALTTNQTENHFHLQETFINFLQEGTKPKSMEEDDGDQKKVQVRCFSSFEQAQKSFSISENGFEYCVFEGKLLEAINQFSRYPHLEGPQESLLKEAANAMAVWGKGETPSFDHVIPLFVAYRSTTEDNAIKPLHLAHVDINEEKLAKVSEKLEWKATIEQVLGRILPEEEYSKMEFVKIINLWVSLNRKPSGNTLALLDQASVSEGDFFGVKNNQNHILRVYHNPKQQWNACLDMVKGKGIIFNSMRTGHTAADFKLPEKLPGQNHRNSCEIQLAFIKLN